jgi:hypothetical protein
VPCEAADPPPTTATAYPIAATMVGDGGGQHQAVHLARRLLDIAPARPRTSTCWPLTAPGGSAMRSALNGSAMGDPAGTRTRASVAFQAATRGCLRPEAERVCQQRELADLCPARTASLRLHHTLAGDATSSTKRPAQAVCCPAAAPQDTSMAPEAQSIIGPRRAGEPSDRGATHQPSPTHSTRSPD